MEETPATPLPEVSYNAFFYGTLLHPKVLKRVIRNTGEHLKISPAVLEVGIMGILSRSVAAALKHYQTTDRAAAIISAKSSHETFQTEPDDEKDCVRGSYVSGLTSRDLLLLDYFESNLYTRERVEVRLLAEPVDLDNIELDTLIKPMTKDTIEAEMVEALTYVWSNPISQLKAEPWSFAEFVETKLSDWA